MYILVIFYILGGYKGINLKMKHTFYIIYGPNEECISQAISACNVTILKEKKTHKQINLLKEYHNALYKGDVDQFCRTDKILRNISHIWTKCGEYYMEYYQSHKTLL